MGTSATCVHGNMSLPMLYHSGRQSSYFRTQIQTMFGNVENARAHLEFSWRVVPLSQGQEEWKRIG
ncbi:predicted protein [Sclerotinia sclerotiorum 1980 UF-70]|uniref:Uncharacterized protein n=1 Tax=Sclerotinia sclerotiorum (strain ATCC 18683 / 1980 / Ss-1) TaxID=665079 RepID=A7F326_SCLS1|nr:predicted protein [Sclerotinia sclerotiorum 1980 UF-70]EDN96118.1 predicted protein [Sclerotinia sclerotiorum 1980 UF-70]